MRDPITDAELEQWAAMRADDAGHLARELSTYRRHVGFIAAIAERRRQVEGEGWTPEHDDRHTSGELAIAAACYALNAVDDSDGPEMRRIVAFELWPWADEWWKPTTPRHDLVKAVALLIAEIERIDRAAARIPGENP